MDENLVCSRPVSDDVVGFCRRLHSDPDRCTTASLPQLLTRRPRQRGIMSEVVKPHRRDGLWVWVQSRCRGLGMGGWWSCPCRRDGHLDLDHACSYCQKFEMHKLKGQKKSGKGDDQTSSTSSISTPAWLLMLHSLFWSCLV